MISVSTSTLKEAKWWEYVLRFILGGLVTAGAGVIAKKLGPSCGGLLLAFPAILAASTTLVEKHERERKEQVGLSGKDRGRDAAGADGAGASLGSIGLIVFAVVVWSALPTHSASVVIAVATLVWALVCAALWFLWKRKFLRDLSMWGSKDEQRRRTRT